MGGGASTPKSSTSRQGVLTPEARRTIPKYFRDTMPLADQGVVVPKLTLDTSTSQKHGLIASFRSFSVRYGISFVNSWESSDARMSLFLDLTGNNCQQPPRRGPSFPSQISLPALSRKFTTAAPLFYEPVREPSTAWELHELVVASFDLESRWRPRKKGPPVAHMFSLPVTSLSSNWNSGLCPYSSSILCFSSLMSWQVLAIPITFQICSTNFLSPYCSLSH